ncbi:MAG: hypothetical protein J7L98_00790 [Candidatus Verstraetearchaeota archaeon]|nr:hypothetical protein [Candidatus Verstraetearchaeota archaeon]
MKAWACSPCGISSFFEVPRNLSKDPRAIGSRGGGFCITKGVTAEVSIEPISGETSVVETFINGHRVDFYIARRAALKVLSLVDEAYRVVIRQKIEPPIGCGFGTSAASALATALATSKALGLNLSLWKLAEIAHVVEVECCTGLGTVSGLVTGGVVIVKKPGAPREGYTLQIPADGAFKIVAAAFQPIEKKKVLLSKSQLQQINSLGRRALQMVLAKPTLDTFLKAAKFFSENSGLASRKVRIAIALAERRGALAAFQNMIGEAIHAIVPPHRVDEVVQALEELSPPRIMVSDLHFEGLKARLAEHLALVRKSNKMRGA